jgi:hypothetical protein
VFFWGVKGVKGVIAHFVRWGVLGCFSTKSRF